MHFEFFWVDSAFVIIYVLSQFVFFVPFPFLFCQRGRKDSHLEIVICVIKSFTQGEYDYE